MHSNTKVISTHTTLGAAKTATRKRKKEIAEKTCAFQHKSIEISPRRASTITLLIARSRLVGVFIAIVFVLVAYQAALVTLSPKYKLQAALVTANAEPFNLELLNRQVERLSSMIETIDTQSLGDIRNSIELTIRLTKRAKAEFLAQYSSWSELRGQIKNDSATYNALKAQLTDTQKMQEQEIIRLKEMLDKAQRPSIWSDVGNLLLSFFLGILSSIFASGLYTRYFSPKEKDFAI